MGIVVDHLTKRFNGVPALDGITCELPEGKICGVVGPDAAGKTTLIRTMAGLMEPDGGSCHLLGMDVFSQQKELHASIGYMPQRFGLYEDLTVAQNLTLYSKLQGVKEKKERQARLLSFANLTGFESHLARDLSGGMKQKLGLICSFLKKPKALLLDEPSVGVDPLSRQELWAMIEDLKKEGVTIVWSTSYLDEAQKCDYVLLLDKGKILFAGQPKELTEQLTGRTYLVRGALKRKILDHALEDENVIDAIIQGSAVRLVLKESGAPPALGEVIPTPPSFEDAFISLLGGVRRTKKIAITPKQEAMSVAVHELTRDFGKLRAVDHLSFEVHRGEIFGLLGPNGAGKSTTFKMLLGLVRPTSGDAYVANLSMLHATSRARAKVGYMAQKFALYDNMTVLQNLRFFHGAYGVKKKGAIDQMVELFELQEYLDQMTGKLPLGMKQRLALACSLMHEPDVLFLDEPTSGVDPLTRREFWYHINTLAEQGVTVLVSTHFMEEAEYCDRIGLIHLGKLRILDTPSQIKESVRSPSLPDPTLEDAFIQICTGVTR